MPRYRKEPHGVQQAWSASGNISLDLSNKPFTITRMQIIVTAKVTTTTPTWYNDPYDRVISRLNLLGKGKTFFDFTNMRVPYHMSRFGGFAPRRPTVVADSSTGAKMYFSYIFHFGVAPFRINAAGMIEDNPFDLTAGIPPTDTGNLTLGGSFAVDTAMGTTSVTTTDGDLQVYLWGVQPMPGDAPASYMPQAIPEWSMSSPTPTATTAAFGDSISVPAGGFLHSITMMTARQSNYPRDDQVLTSLELYNQRDNRSIIKYGPFASDYTDAMAAHMSSQFEERFGLSLAPTDNQSTAMDGIGTPTLGVPAVANIAYDAGLFYFPLHRYASGPGAHPLYGIDMRGVNTGDLLLRVGVGNVTTITLDNLYRRYQPLGV